MRSDHEISICRIENTPNTPLIGSTPYLLSTTSVNTSKAIADALIISANKTRLRLQNYMDEKYDQAALKHLKKEILNNVKQQLVKTLKEQLDIFKSKTNFLREEVKEKNNILKMFFHSFKPSPPGNGFILP